MIVIGFVIKQSRYSRSEVESPYLLQLLLQFFSKIVGQKFNCKRIKRKDFSMLSHQSENAKLHSAVGEKKRNFFYVNSIQKNKSKTL